MRRGWRAALGLGATILVGAGIGWAVRARTPPAGRPAARPGSASGVLPRAASGAQRPAAADSAPAVPPIPHAATTSGDATASWEAAAHQGAPPVAVQTVPSLTVPGQVWAVAPAGVVTRGLSAPTLWAGVETGPTWRWTPTTLPGAIPAALPAPFRLALQWAYDLHEGAPGPDLPGPLAWNGLAGQVGEPVGWTLAPLSAQDSLLNQRTVVLTVWLPSYRYPGAYCGLVTAWDRQNAAPGPDLGQGALWQIQSGQGLPLKALLQPGG